jgi:3-dehydroquinate synthetase
LNFKICEKPLSKNLPDFHISEDKIDVYPKALSRDKKNSGNNLVCILANGPGSMKKEQIPFDENLKDIIFRYIRLGN